MLHHGVVLVYVLAGSASDGMGCGAHEGSLGLGAAAEPCEDCTGIVQKHQRTDGWRGRGWGGGAHSRWLPILKLLHSTFSSCDAG